MTTKCGDDDADETTVLLQLAYENALIYLYEVILHIPAPSTSTGTSSNNLGLLLTKHNILLARCLEVTKAFMDFYVQIPLQKAEQQTTIEKGYLAHAAIVLVKLAFNTVGATHEIPFPLRKACNVSQYLEKLADPQRHPNTPSGCQDKGEDDDSMAHIRDQILRMKAWYDRMEYMNEDGNVEDLKGMSPLQLQEIAKRELPPLEIDWAAMDFMSFDVTNLWD